MAMAARACGAGDRGAAAPDPGRRSPGRKGDRAWDRAGFPLAGAARCPRGRSAALGPFSFRPRWQPGTRRAGVPAAGEAGRPKAALSGLTGHAGPFPASVAPSHLQGLVPGDPATLISSTQHKRRVRFLFKPNFTSRSSLSLQPRSPVDFHF